MPFELIDDNTGVWGAWSTIDTDLQNLYDAHTISWMDKNVQIAHDGGGDFLAYRLRVTPMEIKKFLYWHPNYQEFRSTPFDSSQRVIEVTLINDTLSNNDPRLLTPEEAAELFE